MKLVRWRPGMRRHVDVFGELMGLHEEMDRLFNTSLLSGSNNAAIAYWHPEIDVFEEEGSIVVKADLPGLEKDDIHVDIESGVLTVKGERQSEKKEESKGYYRCERTDGKFERKFELPGEIDASKVKAEFKNGVLEVTLPKSEEVKEKKIEVDVK